MYSEQDHTLLWMHECTSRVVTVDMLSTACPFFIKFALIMGSSSLSVWIYLRQFSQHSLMPSQWLWCCSSRLWHCTKVNDKHQISLISCVLCLLNWHVLQMKYWHYHRAKHRCMINGRLWEYDEPAYNASCIVLPIGVHHCMISLCLSTLCAWHTRWTLADLHDLTLLYTVSDLKWAHFRSERV